MSEESKERLESDQKNISLISFTEFDNNFDSEGTTIQREILKQLIESKNHILKLENKIDAMSSNQRYFRNEGSDSETLQKEILKEIMESKAQIENLEKKIDAMQTDQKLLRNEFISFKEEQRSKQLASGVIARKSLSLIQSISKNVNAITGYEPDEENILTLMPVKNTTDLEDLEAKLNDTKLATKLIAFLKQKRITKGFDAAFRFLANDELYHLFNIDGRFDKKALLGLKLFETIFYEAAGCDRKEYQSELRKCILKSHNRYNRSKCSGRKNQVKMNSTED